MSNSAPRSTHLPTRAVANFLALALVASAASPGPATAQESVLLRGVVAEAETGRLIPSVTVTLVGTKIETRSDDDGLFTFAEAPLGRVLIRVRAPGYPTVVEEVETRMNGEVFVPIFLISATAVLDELIVTGRRTEARKNPQAATAADLLALQLPDLSGGTTLVRPRVAPQRLGLRGRGTFGGDGEPMIVLDGAVLKGGLDLLRQIPAAQVKTIRILKGPSAAFLYGSSDGVIYIQTEAGPPAP